MSLSSLPPKESSLLLVTDMQVGFLDMQGYPEHMEQTVSQLIANVRDLVTERVARGNPVALIEYDRFWSTHPEILAVAQGVPILRKRVRSLLGTEDYNACYITAARQFLREVVPMVQQVDVVGVNTGDCVLDTASDIREERLHTNVRILPGYTLRIPMNAFVDDFEGLNDLSLPLNGTWLWYKEEITKLLPKEFWGGVNLVEEVLRRKG